MQACVKEAKKKLVVKNVQIPVRIEDDDVLIKISKVGICGSDLHLWHLEDRIGLIMGHEFCGVVVEPGASIFKAGERVAVIPKGPRGYQSTPGVLADGAYAEYFMAAAKYVTRIPDDIDDCEASMIEPCGIAYKAAKKAAIQLGDKVLVEGAGIIGLLAAAWAKAMGAAYVALTEVNPQRLQAARDLTDADAVFDSKNPNIGDELLKASHGGFDKVIECTAVSSAVNLGLDMLKPGGKMIFVGVTYNHVPINALKLVMKELVIEGIFGSSVVFEEVIEILSQQIFNLKKYISKEIGLEDIQQTFEELEQGDSGYIKVVISPQLTFEDNEA
ncbi:zinc-dependent alcohol dehydrogenase [Anoxynatronum buryatiense]|uniref:L-iditol 2-dehydrogenase n=1 Tax=Anoxynatronum buryatiense TaxID=489973 RepID=A0AA46AI30_9CLOT|nr:zinc-binding dehydrogenase [Anoxynatronum buryatiense]SMP45651.1 L-iditol 2-dehydrogenase [Anoxynatronum buryatiense]